MTLRTSLDSRPVIFEVVPPRRDHSRFNTELKGVEEVLTDGRIAAINVPELINRVEAEDGGVFYSPATFPPEDYAILIKKRKEPIVNIVAPRMKKRDLVRRARKVLREYGIPNIVLVGKERSQDRLDGPGVLDALESLKKVREENTTFGGVCIFSRESLGDADYRVEEGNGRLSEARRTLMKARWGCEFVTSQITFDSEPALRFLVSYQRTCNESGEKPLTVFISLATVPSQKILSLLESLDVIFPPKIKKRLLDSTNMGKESLRIASEVFEEIVGGAKREGLSVPLGLQVDQVGVNNDQLSLELLDSAYGVLRGA